MGSKISMISTMFVIFGLIGKTRWPPWPLIGWVFLTSLKPLNRFQRNLKGSKISTSSTMFVFFGLIGSTRWSPLSLIGWNIFDFSSETAEQNSTKLYGKQDLNVLYQVRVFRAHRKKNKMAKDHLRYASWYSINTSFWIFFFFIFYSISTLYAMIFQYWIQ